MARILGALYQCNGCAGTYTDVQADGTLYFHACAPLIDPKTGRDVLRAGHRDENLVVANDGRAIGIKAEGAGTTPLNPQSPATPLWYGKLLARLAREAKSDGA